MAKRGKKYIEALSKIDNKKLYNISEAVAIVKQIEYIKFSGTLDVSIKLNLKKNHIIRDSVVLPNQFVKDKKILVFARGDKINEAKEAGATYIGEEDLISKIKDGWDDFDIVISTPDMMKEVGKLGPILGKKGLMPNPRSKTVTNDLKGIIMSFKKGRTEFRANKNGVINFSFGKSSMGDSSIRENYEEFIKELLKKKPSDLKGAFIESVYISSTMGPSLKIDFA